MPQNSAIKIELYGDESTYQEVVTYAFLITPPSQRGKVIEEIARVQAKYDVDPDAEIHCREIFNSRAREKTPFRHLTKNEIFSLLFEVASSAFAAGGRAWIGYLNIDTAPKDIYFNWIGPPTDKKLPQQWNISNVKTQMYFAYSAAITAITSFVPSSTVAAWVDGDRSKVPYVDESRRQVDSLRPFFPIDHNNKQFSPIACHENKPKLLQLADVLAFTAAHGMVKKDFPDKAEHLSVLNAMFPGYSEVFFPNMIEGSLLSVRMEDHNDHIRKYMRSWL
jgi:hypothetical protein